MIDWNYPEPRNGFDKFFGPGATKAELIVQFTLAGLFAVGVVSYAFFAKLGWTWWQYLVGFLIAADIAGGITTNATSSAKRWYHREGQTFKQHFGFVLLHLLQIVIISWVFMGFNLRYILISYGFLVIGALVILLTKHYLQRMVALFIAALGIVLAFYVLDAPPGVEWFAPMLFIKILVSHLLKEEPYYE